MLVAQFLLCTFFIIFPAVIACSSTYSSSDAWYGIAVSSTTGQYVYALMNQGTGSIFKNSNYGISGSWSTIYTQTGYGWTYVVTSSSGQYVYACVHYGYVYYSSDYGVSWTEGIIFDDWNAVACNAAGSIVYAVADNSNSQTGRSMYSTNYGASWTTITSASYWVSVATTTSGTTVFAAISGGFIYYNTNTGSGGWTTSYSLSGSWFGLACSV
jgi:hypothetical protein